MSLDIDVQGHMLGNLSENAEYCLYVRYILTCTCNAIRLCGLRLITYSNIFPKVV